MPIHTRTDYVDLDGKVLLSDPITCAEDEEHLHAIANDPRVWDIIFYGRDGEELGRVSRVTEVDGEEPSEE
jgi:hypothetical protein